VDTVFAAAANRTPVMLVRGSGRAADLLADCVRVHERGMGVGIDDDEEEEDAESEDMEDEIVGELDVSEEDDEEAVEQEGRTRGVVSGFLACLRQLRDLALRRSTGADWPPRLPPGFRMGGDDEPWATSPRDNTEEAEEELLRRAIRAGRAVFREYGVDFPSASDDDDVNGARAGRALVLSSRLYDCVRSRLCVVFDLAAHTAAGTAAATGGWESGGAPWNGSVRGHLVECLIRRVSRDAEARAVSLVLRQWRQYRRCDEDGGRLGSANNSRCTNTSASGPPMGGKGTAVASPAIKGPSSSKPPAGAMVHLPSALTGINGEARRSRLRLLIEFGQTRAARELLGRLATKGILTADRELLGDVLHVALRFGSREAVGELLRRGADLDLYARRAAIASGPSGNSVTVAGTALCDLVVAAGRREITSYVRDLMRAALTYQKDGETSLVEQHCGTQLFGVEMDMENLMDDRQARMVLDMIYAVVMAGIWPGAKLASVCLTVVACRRCSALGCD
jgi:hypothetical protein